MPRYRLPDAILAVLIGGVVLSLTGCAAIATASAEPVPTRPVGRPSMAEETAR